MRRLKFTHWFGSSGVVETVEPPTPDGPRTGELHAVAQPASLVDFPIGPLVALAAPSIVSASAGALVSGSAAVAALAATVAAEGTVTGGAVGLADLLAAVSSQTCQFLFCGDNDYSSSGGTTTWSDQSGQGRHVTIADANAPVSTQYAAIDNKFAPLANGSSQYIQHGSLVRGTNWWYLFVVLPVSWASGSTIMASATTASRQQICQNPTAAPNCRLQGTSNGPTNSGLANGSWKRVRARFAGGTAAYLRVGSTNATGTDPGTAPSTGMRFFAGGTATPAGYLNGAIALAAAWADEPTSGEMSAIDNWITSYYGAGVGVG